MIRFEDRSQPKVSLPQNRDMAKGGIQSRDHHLRTALIAPPAFEDSRQSFAPRDFLYTGDQMLSESELQRNATRSESSKASGGLLGDEKET